MITRIVIVVTLFAAAAALAAARAALHVSGGAGAVIGVLSFLAVEAVLLVGVLERRSPVFGRIFWRGSRELKQVALTFDDGPNEPYTGLILDILARFDIKATFFVIGGNVERHPDALRRVVTEGHEVGNHTYGHDVLPLRSPRFIGSQIARTSDLVESVAGVRPTLFRAPHGWRNPWLGRVVRSHGLTPVAWSLGVWDTDRPGAGAIVERTMKGLGNGCVLLLHDGRGTEEGADSSQLVEALPVIIERARSRGLRFVKLTDMMRERATT